MASPTRLPRALQVILRARRLGPGPLDFLVPCVQQRLGPLRVLGLLRGPGPRLLPVHRLLTTLR